MSKPMVEPIIKMTIAMQPAVVKESTYICHVCNKPKSMQNFRKNKYLPGGFDVICKDCKAKKPKQEIKRKAKTTMPESSESSPQPSTTSTQSISSTGTCGSRTAPISGIAITFTQETQPLYDFLKRYAAQNFRTPENQLLWELKCLSESTQIKRQYPFFGNIQPLKLDKYGPDRV